MLTKLFGCQLSLFNERHKCLQIVKSEHEDFVTYAGRVNQHCERFQVSKLTVNDFKCLVFVSGLKASRDADVRQRLLAKIDIPVPENGTSPESPTLEKLSDECNRLLSLKQDAALIESTCASKPMLVNKVSKPYSSKASTRVASKTTSSTSEKAPKNACWFCGDFHYARNCPFKDHRCKQCRGVGHKEGYCSATNIPKKKPGKFKFKNMQSNNLFVVNKTEVQHQRKYIEIFINDCPVKLQIDTASDLSIISQETWTNIGKPQVASVSNVVKSATANEISFIGQFECVVKCNGRSEAVTCSVAKDCRLDLLGIDWICKFNLWDLPINAICCNSVQTARFDDVQQLQKDFPKVFQEGLGLCTKAHMQLHLKENAKPVFRPKRPVAYAVLSLVEGELERLQEQGAITSVDFSQWAAPIVVVRKGNGKIRICADFSTGLNDALESDKYPLPTPEDLIAKVSYGTIFSHIDLSDAYLQVPLDEKSKELVVVNTHKGLFKFNRLPAGVKPAANAFQRLVDTMLAGLDGVAVYIDDIIVTGANKSDHDSNLLKVLQRIEDYGFRLRIEKCRFFMKELKYLGHILNGSGIRLDETRVEKIKKMPAPKNVAELRSFLGAINYYSKFVSSMHKLRGPLDSLLQKNVTWNWNKNCQSAFEKLKETLSSGLLLTHFNPQLEIIVAADASNYGLGACLLHQYPDGTQKAVYHASRSLTKAEKGYGQIEKEALALIFAVTKFHKFIFGRRFLLQTDHKPLLAIFGSKKGIPAHTANRLQRWALTLLNYDFQIVYVPTDKFGHADVLSRLISLQDKPNEDYVIASTSLESDIEQAVTEAIQKLPLTFNMIRNETEKCELLKEVQRCVDEGWIKRLPKGTNDEFRQFHARRESLSNLQGCLMYGERIVIPGIYRKRVLRQLHKGHPGTDKMKSLARSYVYWPGLDGDVIEYVQHCDKCAMAAKAPVKTDLASWPQAERPWQRLHIDFAGPFMENMFLVVVDSYTKYPEVIRMSSTTASATVRELQKLFSHFGNPETLVSDNGTQFKSSVFDDFVTANGITHLFSPPYHPQSNGQAERFVDTLKRGLTKLKGEGDIHQILHTFLLHYRAIPNRSAPLGKSPAELLFNRKIRLPLDLMKPIKHQPPAYNTQQEQQFNKHHGTRKTSFDIGESVYVRRYVNNKPVWKPGKVMERFGKVVYNVLLEKCIIRAHCNQMRKRFKDGSAEKQGESATVTGNPLLELFDIENEPVASTAQSVEIEPDTPDNSTDNANLTSATDRSYPTPRIARPVRQRRPPAWTRDFEL